VEDAVLRAAPELDLLRFAQASMARLVPRLEGRIPIPLLASPRLAMQEIARVLGAA
jgi:hypothetical protein